MFFLQMEAHKDIRLLTLLTAKGLDPESPGIILYDVNNTKQTILFTMASVDGTVPKLGDKVPYRFSSLIMFLLH